MRNRLGLALALLLIAIPLPGAHANSSVEMKTDHKRYAEGDVVTITLTNNTAKTVQMSQTWQIQDLDRDSGFGQYYWPEDQMSVAPGESRTWKWEQHGRCDGECQNVWEGEAAKPGRYAATAEVDGATITAQFTIGAYFTLMFDCCSNDEFTVFVARDDDVEAMRNEANSQDKTLIVSGMVRSGRAGYNSHWSYTMGPRSIVMGEVFTEVCDAAPGYVEHHRKQWTGQRWCPWSSHVAHEGP